MRKIVSLFVAIALAGAGCARETQVTSPSTVSISSQVPVNPDGTLPPGTTVWARLDQPLNPKFTRIGDRFTATVSQDVLSTHGDLLIPRGAKVSGQVIDLRASPRAGQPASIGLAIDTIEMAGIRQPVQATITETRGATKQRGKVKGSYALIGTAAGAILGATQGVKGAIVGGALGAGAGALISLGTSKTNPELPAGAQLAVRLDAPVRSLASLQGRRVY